MKILHARVGMGSAALAAAVESSLSLRLWHKEPPLLVLFEELEAESTNLRLRKVTVIRTQNLSIRSLMS